MKQILDMACGSRMFWYQPDNENVEFVDKRKGTYDLGAYPTKSGKKQRTITVSPTTQADFRNLPFKDNSFYLVVFDPPHLKRAGDKRGKTRWLVFYKFSINKNQKTINEWQKLNNISHNLSNLQSR